MSNKIKLKGFRDEVSSRSLCPSWEQTAEICIMVLQNPKAQTEATIFAEDTIRQMAKIAAQAAAEQEKK